MNKTLNTTLKRWSEFKEYVKKENETKRKSCDEERQRYPAVIWSPIYLKEDYPTFMDWWYEKEKESGGLDEDR